MRTSRIFLALGVVLIGLIVAWPFRQESAQPLKQPAHSAKPLQLTVRRPDIPLELAPRIDVSPAEGLRSEEVPSEEPRTMAARLPAAGSYALDSLAPPPALPVSFQPSLPPAQINDWRPDAVVKPAASPQPPRPYRIRDRDTLELIAERLLGDRQRAAEIFEGNRNVISRPDVLPVGVTILLPPRESRSDLEPAQSHR